MIRSKWLKIVFIVLFVLGMAAFSQDKQSVGDKDKGLREEILVVYQSKGESGLRDFFREKAKEITGKFILDFAEAGVNERKEEWMKACEIMAEEKKDEKTLADVLYKTGEYFRLISEFKKADDYIDKALLIYQKLNDPIGQGNVYMLKGNICCSTGEIARALELTDKSLYFFKKIEYSIGLGNVYHIIGVIYLRMGENLKAVEALDKALIFFEKSGHVVGQGNVYMTKGMFFLRVGDNSKSLEMFDKAIPFFEKFGEHLGQGNIYWAKGNIYSRTGDISKALEMYDKALPYYEKVSSPTGQGNVYKDKGYIYLGISDNSKAIEMFDKALPFFEKNEDPIGLGYINSGKGSILFRIGEYSKALEMFDKALTFFKKAGDPIGQGRVYHKIGVIYLQMNNYLMALEMLDKAFFFIEKAADKISLGNIYESKGDINLIIGENSKALEMFDKALLFFEKAKNPLGQGNIYESKGIIFLHMGENSKALEMYDKAIPFFEKAGDPVGLGNIYTTKGNFYSKIKQNYKALEMYDNALPFFKKADSPFGQGNVYLDKGVIYLKLNDNSKALEMYNKAILSYKKTESIEPESYALYGKAQVFANQGGKKEALKLLEKSISNLERVRMQVVISKMKKTFLEKVYGQYRSSVLFMLDNKYYKKGLTYAESMRARVFLDQMAEGLLPLEKGLKTELKAEKDLLVGKLSALSRQMQETPGNDEKKLQELREEYRKVESQFDDLLIKIRLENPLYASVNYPQPISVQDLQKDILKDGETMLSYFISQDGSYAFVISKNDFNAIQLKMTEEKVNGLVNRYLLSIMEKNAYLMEKYGSILYEKLFNPLEKYLAKNSDIIIVPAGQLETIPFESFIINQKKPGPPVYLLEKYRLKYVQSATLLSILRKYYNGNSNAKGFIGFGDPVYDYENFKQNKPEQGSMKILATESTEGTESLFSRKGTRRDAKKKGPPMSSVAIEDEIKEIHRDRFARAGGIMDRLPQSGEEIQTIARLFEKESPATKVYLREQAAEENARADNMKDYAYIHFSCHGLLNDDFQCLVLSQLPGAKEDGYFTLNEIMNCDYNAKLIVLSACRTGSGKMARGEGITGLTRAFMYAGSPAVVASLWDVDDAATKELMVKFYSNMLEKNLDKVEALRQAKLELLKDKKYFSPLFWSAFVMYGE